MSVFMQPPSALAAVLALLLCTAAAVLALLQAAPISALYLLPHRQPPELATPPPTPLLPPPLLAWVVAGPSTEANTAALRSLTASAGGSPCTTPPLVPCYFSTWAAEGASPVARAYAAANFTLILSQPPNFSGWHNVNMQLVNSRAGLVAAAAAGATHAIKMRGDVHVTDARAFLRVVGAPQRLTMMAWIRYITEYLVAGPMDDMLGLFGSQLQPAGDDRFSELYMMETYARPRNLSHAQLCRSVARWVDRQGRPAGGATALPAGLIYWKCAGGQLSPACDLGVGLRGWVKTEDACDYLLLPGCHHAC